MTVIEAGPGCVECLALRPGVSLVADPDSTDLHLLRRGIWRHSESFDRCGDAHRELLTRLAHGPLSVVDLPSEVTGFVERLRAGGWLITTVRRGDRDLYTVQPLHRTTGRPGVAAPGLVLSRFALLHREGERLVVESPLAQARVQVHDPAVMAFVAALVVPESAEPATLPGDVAERLRADLCWAGLLVVPGSEESTADTAQWSPHELWFHARSRMGNGGYAGTGFGRTNWGKERFAAVPPRPEPFAGRAVDLPSPDLAGLRVHDRPLAEVMEDRRSLRTHDDERPITVAQLGELLYRSARVRRSYQLDGTECLSEPYPSGGSVYEIELYPVVRLASGLKPGMYHYDKHAHRLNMVRDGGPEVSRLLWTSTAAAVVRTPPQVLIVLTARFGRLMRTYEEVPYSLVLKHVGALYQTMQLVATSMGLAACGLGAGDPASFGAITGLEFTAESGVGEFMLGSPSAE